jgi:hypothetical protein
MYFRTRFRIFFLQYLLTVIIYNYYFYLNIKILLYI